MFDISTTAEKAQNLTLKPYEDKEQQAGEAYFFAKKYGKKTEITEARKEWEQALAVVVAVDQAITTFRDNLEKEQETLNTETAARKQFINDHFKIISVS